MFQVFGSSVLVSVCKEYAPFPCTFDILNGPSQVAASFPCPGGFWTSSSLRRMRSPCCNVRGRTRLLYFHCIVACIASCLNLAKRVLYLTYLTLWFVLVC